MYGKNSISTMQRMVQAIFPIFEEYNTSWTFNYSRSRISIIHFVIEIYFLSKSFSTSCWILKNWKNCTTTFWCRIGNHTFQFNKNNKNRSLEFKSIPGEGKFVTCLISDTTRNIPSSCRLTLSNLRQNSWRSQWNS